MECNCWSWPPLCSGDPPPLSEGTPCAVRKAGYLWHVTVAVGEWGNIVPMNIIIGLLPDTHCLVAYERDVGVPSSRICTIMYTHLKLHETSFGALWPILVPYLNISTRTG